MKRPALDVLGVVAFCGLLLAGVASVMLIMHILFSVFIACEIKAPAIFGRGLLTLLVLTGEVVLFLIFGL